MAEALREAKADPYAKCVLCKIVTKPFLSTLVPNLIGLITMQL